MDVLMLAVMTNARTVGLTAVATSITQAIALSGQGVGSTLILRMVRSGGMRREWLAILWSVTAIINVDVSEVLEHLNDEDGSTVLQTIRRKTRLDALLLVRS